MICRHGTWCISRRSAGPRALLRDGGGGSAHAVARICGAQSTAHGDVQINGKCWEAPNWCRIAVGGNRSVNLHRSDIDSGGMRLNHGQAVSLVARLGHDDSASAPPRRPGPCKKVVSQTRSAAPPSEAAGHHWTEHGVQDHVAGRACKRMSEPSVLTARARDLFRVKRGIRSLFLT